MANNGTERSDASWIVVSQRSDTSYQLYHNNLISNQLARNTSEYRETERLDISELWEIKRQEVSGVRTFES